jgi:signal transduction histidine kinase
VNPSLAHTPWYQRAWTFTLRAFHAYASWLVGISWKMFILVAVLMLAAVSLLIELPPFTFTVRETIQQVKPRVVPLPPVPALPSIPDLPPMPELPPAAPKAPAGGDVQIRIDGQGVRIIAPKAATEGASAPASPASASASPGANVRIGVEPEATEAIREAAKEIREAAQEAVNEARQAATQALQEASSARAEYEAALAELRGEAPGLKQRVRKVRLGDWLMDFSLLWVLLSIVIKITYKGRLQAETKAAQATETAEAESLRRQVVEARMAAMQAQVEPHFLFNTLASIDHLIETAPDRASQMQKNLIALLRASMPTMREASTGGTRELGREVAVIRPYLEILKVRMEERLQTHLDIPEGLHSAEFPPMMLQSLVENAIKHGLEPKTEGGELRVKAEIVHGNLALVVADTGVGFGQAATRGTGVGLANIRERLQLLYGAKASLSVAENQPSGTRVTITVPYRAVESASGRPTAAAGASQPSASGATGATGAASA